MFYKTTSSSFPTHLAPQPVYDKVNTKLDIPITILHYLCIICDLLYLNPNSDLEMVILSILGVGNTDCMTPIR